MTLDLELNEVQFLLQVLGQLSTSTGAWPLLKKIEEQSMKTVEPVTPKAIK